MIEIDELEQEIRNFINSPRKQHALIKSPAGWNQLCSCLDLIGDTELAIDAYLRHHEPTEDGEKYLLLYAVLQALILQQDAVDNISQDLGIQYTHDQVLQDIRNIRNESIGHPTNVGERKSAKNYVPPKKFCFISRISISKNGFQLMVTFPDERLPEFRDINILDLIHRQREILQNVFSNVIDKLREEEMEHREKFKDKKLQDLFPQTLGYYFGKISEALQVHENVNFGHLGSNHVRLIMDCISEFEKALDERGFPRPSHLIGELSYALEEIKLFFDKPGESKLNKRDAYIFVFYAKEHMKELKESAKEIDEEYSTPVYKRQEGT